MKNRKTVLGWAMVVALSLPVSALAVDYTVRDVPVSASAEDANTARMLAMGQAEQAAFAKLLEQSLPPEQAAAKAASTPPGAISNLVTGYNVKNEKLSTKSYSANIDVSFNPQKVSGFLAQPAPADAAAMPATASASGFIPRPAGTPGAAYSPAAARAGAAPVTPARPAATISANAATLLLPVYDNKGRTSLWETENAWRSVWNSIPRQNTQLLRLPIGDQSDKLVLPSAEQATSYANISTFAERYQAGQVVVARASEGQASTGIRALQVQLLTLTPGGNAQAYPLVFEAEAGESPTDTMIRAAQEISARLTAEGERQQQVAAAAPPVTAYAPEQIAQAAPAQMAANGRITVLSRLSAVNDWIGLRKKLQSVPQVSQVELSAISSQQVDMVLHYSGTLSELEQAINARGLQISKAQNYWVITF